MFASAGRIERFRDTLHVMCMAETRSIGVMIPSSDPGEQMHNDGAIERKRWDNWFRGAAHGLSL